MTLREYLKSRGFYRVNGYSKEESFLRNNFGYTSRKMIVDNIEELDASIASQNELRKAHKDRSLSRISRKSDFNTTYAEWIKYNEHLLRYHQSRKRIDYDIAFNWLLEDLLPLSQALKRGIYNSNGMINVFKDINFKRSVTKRKIVKR